jgi:hypothetical protein
LNIIKYSRTTSRAKWLSDEKTNISRTISVLVFRVLMYLEKQSTPGIGLPEFHTGLYLALRHLPKTAIAFITKLFNVVLRWQYFPPAWKHAHVVSILKPGKDSMLPSSHRPISLLEAVGKLFE